MTNLANVSILYHVMIVVFLPGADLTFE